MVELDVVGISKLGDPFALSQLLVVFCAKLLPRRYRHALRSYHEPPEDTEALARYRLWGRVHLHFIRNIFTFDTSKIQKISPRRRGSCATSPLLVHPFTASRKIVASAP